MIDRKQGPDEALAEFLLEALAEDEDLLPDRLLQSQQRTGHVDPVGQQDERRRDDDPGRDEGEEKPVEEARPADTQPRAPARHCSSARDLSIRSSMR